MLTDTVVWAIVIVVFTVLEGVSVGLTSIWFSVGGLVALLVSLVSDSYWVQIGAFLLVSALCLLALRPLAKQILGKNSQPTNFDRVVGKEGIVTDDICNLEARGSVQVMGQEWSARSVSGLTIPKGATVVVRRIEGVKLFVEPE